MCIAQNEVNACQTSMFVKRCDYKPSRSRAKKRVLTSHMKSAGLKYTLTERQIIEILVKMLKANFFCGFCLFGLLLAVKIEHSVPFFKTTYGNVFLLPAVAKQNSVAYTRPGRVSKIWCSSICSRNDDCHYFHMTSDSCIVIGYNWLEGDESDLVLQANVVVYAKELRYANVPGKQ